MGPTVGWPIAAYLTRYSEQGSVAAGDFMSKQQAKGIYLTSSGYFLKIYLRIVSSIMAFTIFGLCVALFCQRRKEKNT
jgi:hypothetical protein